MSEENQYFYANRMGRIILQSIQDLVGDEEYSVILQAAGFTFC